MRVLMFGWEFPPHISGGLGTACYGLTKSLTKENVDILFVVPKLHGGEDVPRVDFIDAGKVPIKIGSRKEYITQRIEEPGEEVKGVNISITTIEVESVLSPYRSTRYHAPVTHMESWSYTLEPTTHEVTQEIEVVDTFTHLFSGTYGPDLIEETNRYAEVAAEIARNFSFDIIHAHDWMTFPAGIAAQQASNKPLIVHVHSTEFDRSGEYVDQKVYAIEQEGVEKADHILAVSKWTKDILVYRYKIDPSKISVSYNGITPKDLKATPAIPSIGTHVVTFLGRLTYQKGPFYFVEAA
jgi:glycosyltransferase involved in cell wall biosynthesis